VVDGPGVELDGQVDSSGLGELVGMEPQLQPEAPGLRQVAPRVLDVEGAAFDEDINRFCERRRLRENLRDDEVQVGIG
jgi:hypothetical protein